MAALPVTEDKTENREINATHYETVEFTTASADGDYYDSKKFGQIEFAFASQQTSDGNEIQVSHSGIRTTIVPVTGNTKGYLVVVGRK